MFRTTLDDLGYALRMMARRPGLSAVIVLTVAVGIGATTAMFGTINAALLSSLPFEEPERLVLGRATFSGNVNPWVSGYDYFDYRDQNRSLESLAATMSAGEVTVLGGSEPERISGAFVTWDFFPTLRISPVQGRVFRAEEGVEGGPDVVMISHRYWQRRFGGSPDAVGSTLNVNGSPQTIIGVAPPGFYFMREADIWALTYYNGPGATARRWHNLLLVGRLKPGVSLEQAQSEFDVISRQLQEQYPATNETKALLLTGLHDALVENIRTSLLLLMVAVSLVLLLACANVAGLLLARGQSRVTEIAIRSAIGASRRRLVRQLLTESMLMALVAGVGGIALVFVFQRLLVRLLPMGPLGITRAAVDAPVLLFALGVSIATGLVFGMVPALQGSIVDLSQQLRSGARATWGRGSSLLRSGLVVVQVAVSVVLLIGAGLMLRSLSRQIDVDLGFEPADVLTASVGLPRGDYDDAERRILFFTSLVEEVQALPGVASVGLIDRLPIRQGSGNIYLYTTDQPPDGSQSSSMSRSADFRCVLPGYFRAIGIPLLAGRDIAETDVEGSPRVMVVTESLAELFFPGENPLGRELLVDMGELVKHEIVGVVGNARLSSPRSEPFHAMYMSYRQIPRFGMRLAVRTHGVPTALARPLRELLRGKDPNIPLAELATMESILDDTVADHRVITSSLGLLSAIALFLALIGLYGVLAYHVSQRHHEIGVRMVLGARPTRIANLVLSRGMALVVAGLVIGLTGSFWATRVIRQLLFGVESTDPGTFVSVALSFGLIALLACVLPAWRAARVDPVITLQAQ